MPACGKCNQSKSGAHWRKWITGPAKRSPASRGVPDLQARIERLQRFEAWREPKVFNFEDVVGAELWTKHWSNWKKLIDLMHECELTAKEIRLAITRAAEA